MTDAHTQPTGFTLEIGPRSDNTTLSQIDVAAFCVRIAWLPVHRSTCSFCHSGVISDCVNVAEAEAAASSSAVTCPKRWPAHGCGTASRCGPDEHTKSTRRDEGALACFLVRVFTRPCTMKARLPRTEQRNGRVSHGLDGLVGVAIDHLICAQAKQRRGLGRTDMESGRYRQEFDHQCSYTHWS